MVIAVQEPGHEPQFAAVGFANLERRVAMTIESPFFIGSISENFFAVIILQLVGEGVLSLDDPISRFIDWPNGDDIAIHRLLTHTSGIPDYLDHLNARDPEQLRSFFRQVQTTEQLLRMVRDLPARFRPGFDQEHSNSNALLVGLIIEKTTGQSLAEILQQRICEPLNLQNTFLFGKNAHTQSVVPGYQGSAPWFFGEEGNLTEVAFADRAWWDTADGSIVSNARDLLTYHRALREEKLLPANLWNRMRQRTIGFHNGLAYLLIDSKKGHLEGNAGRMIGQQAAGFHHGETGIFLVVLSNRGDRRAPFTAVLEEYLSLRESLGAAGR